MHPTVTSLPRLFVKQLFEIGELFGFECRNKYRVCDETGRDVAFAAEQQKGFLGMLFRNTFGHWRTFEIHFFGLDRQPFMVANHPFRWFFQRLEVKDMSGRYIGCVERQWAILSKKFEVQNAHGQTVLEVSSPFWRIWTFPFYRMGREAARISRKWPGIAYELFTDRDTFLVEYLEPNLTPEERSLILAASLYVDLMYFERKGSGGLLDNVFDN
jgi:uncharacterized protein YxjI